jgi:uncharacterized protein (UPF0276 family)
MSLTEFPPLGAGAGLRREHYRYVSERRPQVDWFEVISENFMVAGGRPLEILDEVRARYPIVLHGVSLSVGSVEGANTEYLRSLAELARRFEPAWISDHLCWTRTGRHNLHDLLPLPYNDEAVMVAAQRIRAAQDALGRRILIENISSYLTYTHSSLKEWEFVSAVAEEADCGILLDINNIFVNAYNHRFSAEQYIDAIPVERVRQFHLAGHRDCGTHLLDTHDSPVRPQVWRLYERALARFGAVSTLIEWDGQLPEFAELETEAAEARRRMKAQTRSCTGPAPQAEKAAGS